MSVSFNPNYGLIVVWAEIWGPAKNTIVRLAVDTGASGTLVNTAVLVSLGYDPSSLPTRIQVTTASGIAFAPRLMISRIRAIDLERVDFPVIAHTLPTSSSVDGLLGLDFFRGMNLSIDFRTGRLSVG